LVSSLPQPATRQPIFTPPPFSAAQAQPPSTRDTGPSAGLGGAEGTGSDGLRLRAPTLAIPDDGRAAAGEEEVPQPQGEEHHRKRRRRVAAGSE
jgi:hypothetical protein